MELQGTSAEDWQNKQKDCHQLYIFEFKIAGNHWSIGGECPECNWPNA